MFPEFHEIQIYNGLLLAQNISATKECERHAGTSANKFPQSSQEH
jgi:hypothetical protein